jgi:arsenite methyltransferase
MDQKGDYGYDAPYALVAFSAVGGALATAAIVVWWQYGVRAAAIPAGYGTYILANAVSFMYTTTRGKFHVWQRINDDHHLRGDERILDMGCGRGAVLTTVGKALKGGRVTGVDVWSVHDQSGNSPDVTRRNAAREGVRHRIDVITADMRMLPFADGTFDVVVSSLAIHNIRSHAARAQAVAEAWRVLKVGGRLVIADIRSTSRYAETLRTLAADSISRRRLGWRFWYGNPFAATSLVTAAKRERR